MTMQEDQRGAILFFTVLILATSALMAFLTLSRATIEGFVEAENHGDAWNTRAELFGCVDELLIQFQEDANYTAIVINTLDAQCAVVITSPQSNERHAVLTWTEGEHTRGVRVELMVNPVVVTRTIEMYN